MKIIYGSVKERSTLTFADVRWNQFFVGENGVLWQKCDDEVANAIADTDGSLMATRFAEFSSDEYIQRILPEIERIEF